MSPEERQLYGHRAALAYRAMLRRFRRRNRMYRYDEGPPLRRTAALWPFSRALMASLDVTGIDGDAAADLEPRQRLAEHLEVLERYWDSTGDVPAYSSGVAGGRVRGDRYYDDNAWVGLALVQLERTHPGSGWLTRAGQLFEFAVSGWDGEGGGVFWVEQGRGTGRRNHDRNTVSTATNAALGLHLRELGRGPQSPARSQGDQVDAEEMYDWVLANLDSSRGSDSPGTGLFWDKVRGDGTIDRSTWSYNQGSMIAASVLLARLDRSQRGEHLDRAEAIARKALREYAGSYERQPASFNAIFFRNLLLLHAQSEDEELRAAILDAIRDFADAAWSEARDRRQLFHLRGRATLLDQSAMVQVLALLAWDPAAYSRLA
jgi:uncharacterized protein YyaL (SSP411 family)